jgi:hypothetical protein
MARRGPRPPDRASRGLTRAGALGLGALVLVLAAAGCAGGASDAPPGAATTKARAAHHRDPFAGARAAALRYLRRREARFDPARLRVGLSTLAVHGQAETVLATVSARLGRSPGTVWVSLGQRALVLRRDGGRVRVAADTTRRGSVAVSRDGVAAMPPRSRLVVGRRVVVVAAPGVSAADAAEVAGVADRTLPGLVARYRLRGARTLPPVIFLVGSWTLAQHVAGAPMPKDAVGAEYQGLVYLDVPPWSRIGTAGRDALVVHELTHVASARLVAGGPLSLIEGVARYEEQQYAIAAGEPWPFRYLAQAYERGYPSLTRWEWTFGHWMVRTPLATWLAYEDGAAIVRAVVHDGGDAALRRLGAAFRRDDVAGRFTARQVDRAFRAAVGRPFAAVAAQARAATIAAAG